MRERHLRNLRPPTDSPILIDSKLRDPSLPEPALDRTAQDRIGAELRAMYADLSSQPIPQRFLDLIEKIGPSGDKKHGN